MAFKIGDLFWKIKGDTKDIDKNLKTTDKKVGGLRGTFGKLSGFVGGAFAVAMVAGIGRVSKELINAASDAEETRNKFNVTFSDIIKDADAAAESLSENFGISASAAEDLLGTTGDLLSGFGFTQTAALDLSTQVNELAADLASFANVPVKQASDAITKGLLGEREAMKSLNIAITEADIKRLAQDYGIVGELDRQQKALLTLELATTQSKNAIGDFGRSQDSFANQSKIAQAAISDLKVEMGKQLLPIATKTVSIFAKIVEGLADSAKEFNNLKDIVKEFQETGEITGSMEELIEKRDLLIKKQREYGREASFVYSEEIAALGDLIIAAEKREQIERRARGQRELGESQAAEAERIRAAAEAQRTEDIARRDEAWKKTEDGRLAAIQAEIEYFKTFKESDEKAQIVLAELRQELLEMETERIAGIEAEIEYFETLEGNSEEAIIVLANLRKELAGLKGDTEELEQVQITSAQNSINRLGEYLLAERVYSKKIHADVQTLGEVFKDNFDTMAEIAGSVWNSMTSFSDAYYDSQLSKYDKDSDEYKRLQLEQFNVNKATSATNAAIAGATGAVEAYKALAGIPYVGPALGIAAAAAIGGFAAAQVGFILSEQPAFEDGGIVPGFSHSGDQITARVNSGEMILNTEQQAKLFDMINGGGGSNITINNLISTGKEAEIRAAAELLYPYLADERIRRGE